MAVVVPMPSNGGLHFPICTGPILGLVPCRAMTIDAHPHQPNTAVVETLTRLWKQQMEEYTAPGPVTRLIAEMAAEEQR